MGNVTVCGFEVVLYVLEITAVVVYFADLVLAAATCTVFGNVAVLPIIKQLLGIDMSQNQHKNCEQ